MEYPILLVERPRLSASNLLLKKLLVIGTKIDLLKNEKREQADLPLEMGNILREHHLKFYSIQSNINKINPIKDFFQAQTLDDSSLVKINFTPEDIVSANTELKSNASTGLDGLPALLLKQC